MFPIVQYPDDREGVVYLLPGVKYRIESLTGRHLMAGCNSVVSIRLVGKHVWLSLFNINLKISANLNNKIYVLFKGETNDWDLNQSAERLLTEKFEANQKDEFIIVDKARD